MSTLTEPTLSDLLAILDEVWGSFLSSPEPLLPASDDGMNHGTSAAVTITGDWRGIVVVETSRPVAEEVTRRMLMLDAVTPDDVADAMGELVNIVGGQVKSLTGGQSTLSLPIVASGHLVQPSEARELCRADLVWIGEPVRVTVLSVRTP